VATVAEPPAATTEPAATTPAAAANADEWVPGEGVVRSGKLKVLRKVDPEYPADAQQGQVTGYVELEYTVAKDGSVKDAVVTSSQPRRVFDSAALTALRRYRYQPVLKDGQPVEQRARMRMGFTLQ
jgi:protein TonB